MCAYGTNTCCGQVYPVIYHCSGNVVVPSLHEPTDCAFIARACVDAGGYDAAAADPQTRDCASPSPAFTSCDSAGQACRDPGPGHGTCICQAATSPDGGAAPFWFCE